MFGFPSLSSPIIFLFTGQTGEPISMIDDSNDVFTFKEMPLWVSRKNFEGTGSETPRIPYKGVIYGFPTKLIKYKKTHISVERRDYQNQVWTVDDDRSFHI